MALNTGNAASKNSGNLRNFDLTVEEIKLVKSIENLSNTVSNIERLDPHSKRAKIIRLEIRRQEEQLEDLRENTLIR